MIPDSGSVETFDGPSLALRQMPFRLGDYLVVEQLGQGGMGSVFLARHGAGGIGGVEKLCVLKTLRPDKEDDEYTRRFFDEARLVVRLSHRNICPVFEVGQVAGRLFLSMDYLPGADLRQVIARAASTGRAIPPALAVMIIGDVLEALDYAHRMEDLATGRHLGVVHRDVSPQNVMVSWEGEVKLIDFGLALSDLKLEKTTPKIVLGKLQYMSPEQARGEPVDGRCDQFAAAVLLYELLSGQRFYGDLSVDAIWRLIGKGGFLPAGLTALDPDLGWILSRAIAAEPDDRYPDCGAFHDALTSLLVEKRWRAGPRELRAFVEELLGDQRRSQRERIQRYLCMDATRLNDVEKTEIRVAVSALGPAELEAIERPVVRDAPPSGPAAPDATEVVRAPLPSAPASARGGRWALVTTAAVVLGAAIAVVGVLVLAPGAESEGPAVTPPVQEDVATEAGAEPEVPRPVEDEGGGEVEDEADGEADDPPAEVIPPRGATSPLVSKPPRGRRGRAVKRSPPPRAAVPVARPAPPAPALPPPLREGATPMEQAQWIQQHCGEPACRRAAGDVFAAITEGGVRKERVLAALARCVKSCRRGG